MKLKQLTSAIAATTLLASSGAFAQQLYNVQSNSPNFVIDGQLMGAWEISGSETESEDEDGNDLGEDEFDSNDFEVSYARLGVQANIAENTIVRFERQFNIGNCSAGSSSRTCGTSSNATTDAFVRHTMKDGAKVLTGGIAKPLLDGNDAMDIEDRVFMDSGSALSFVGSPARTTGVSVDWTGEGFFAGGHLFRNGTSSEDTEDGADDTFETDYNLGFGIRGGGIFDIDGIMLAASLVYFDLDDGESVFEDKDTDEEDKTESDTDGFGIDVLAKVGNVNLQLNWADGDSDSERENDFNPATDFERDESRDALYVTALWNVYNANRDITNQGTLGAPQVASGQKGLELGIRIGTHEVETDFGSSDSESETDTWALVGNWYCGEFFKAFAEIGAGDTEFEDEDGDKDDTDSDYVKLGARIIF